MKHVFVALVVLSVLVGCQRSQDKATEAVVERIIASKGRESDVEIDREHGSIRVTLGGAIKPQGWPSAVPIYPHAERAKIEKAEKIENKNTGDSKRLSVTTADSVADLRSFYREALAKDGWAVGDGEGKASPWSARRGDEDLEIVFVGRDHGKGSRADIEYRKRS